MEIVTLLYIALVIFLISMSVGAIVLTISFIIDLIKEIKQMRRKTKHV